MKNLNTMTPFSKILLALVLATVSVVSQAKKETITFIHTDHLGSPIMATNEDGSVKWREDYQPFGKQLTNQDTDNNVGFTGHLDDKGLGLSYMQARWYNPTVGRFMSPDPVRFVDSNAMSYNRYLYVNNNPYKYTDPNGEFLNFAVKFVVDVAVESAIQYATTGKVDLGSAMSDAAMGMLNPVKTLNRVKTLSKLMNKKSGSSPCQLSCFVAGTKVLSKTGYTAIENIVEGDLVWAKNVDTGDYNWKPVTKTWVVDKKPIYRVSVKTKQDSIQTIDATSSHPFFVKDKGWVNTIDLIPGDYFENKEGDSLEVLSIEDLKKQQVAYNFTVADFHTYYVTKQNVLVHNCGKTQLPDSRIAQQEGVTIEHYYKGNDHSPAHLHVSGGDGKTKIGQNGKPISGSPELTKKQKKVVEANKSKIRRAVKKIGKVLQDRSNN